MDAEKKAVWDFWNEASCGEALYLRGNAQQAYEDQAAKRYALEPYIAEFADFTGSKGQEVLEIGVGLGADHQRFAAAGARLYGIDLTPRAVEHTRTRLTAAGLESDLRVADAEALPFGDSSFDKVYSWGVLHHSPDTGRAVSEVLRVLRPGGVARVMVYHTHSMIGYMLWLRYALLVGRPNRSLADVYAHHLESPGTKAYSVQQAREMFGEFARVEIDTILTHGDLLESEAGQRHRGVLLKVGRVLWPRWLIRRILPKHGLFMLIRAVK